MWTRWAWERQATGQDPEEEFNWKFLVRNHRIHNKVKLSKMLNSTFFPWYLSINELYHSSYNAFGDVQKWNWSKIYLEILFVFTQLVSSRQYT